MILVLLDEQFAGDSDLIFTLRNFTKLHILRYLGIYNVLHIWHIRVIPTYRVYRLYDYLCLQVAQMPADFHATNDINYQRLYLL